MKGKKNCNSGFSLIELLVGLAISCIVLVAAYSFVLAGINSYDRTRKTTDIQQETQFIENIVVDAVENGSKSASSITDNTSTTGLLEFDTGYQILFYNSNTKELALYEHVGDTPGTNIKQHLVSENVEEFKVSYINTDFETDASNEYVTDAAGDKVYVEKTTMQTNLVEVDVKVVMNGKSDSSAKQYKFRNS